MTPLMRLLLVTACLYALGAATLLAANWLGRWPWLKLQVVRLGQAACTFALGVLGLLLVLVLLNALGFPLARRLTHGG